MKKRQLSFLDRVIDNADVVLRTLAGNANRPGRPSPAEATDETELSPEARRHAAGLMRVNHTGEVCAQALYQGQALTARLPDVREDMEQAAAEEIDHLVWCEQRLKQLGSHTSLLNPLWYGLSFSLGAVAGIAGDRWSLGFVAATEERVCRHLEDHLEKLPEDDLRSRRIVEQMLEDERRHGEAALDAGGTPFPEPVKQAMAGVARIMTGSSYRV
ncbi:MAG: 2-polyprenyl-3-methyl-6-methoxy-1,4-benzoquinone monooxygenase [Halieaceae bacterium]|jgi:ubiquinone biosynthesis monooxygenase Coq7|nr:2-polyprenyl-3-methyl-6-methoxy-1,4-benzoquinone monooxygenase [Halieaceae bacterium]